jgi:branched-subunit amino acid aminotransferase/4-amino-4-deoxychorismate lyase
VFETCKVVSGVIYNYEAHHSRLRAGLEGIKINYDTSELQKSAYKLIKKNNLSDGIVRIFVSRGIGSHGYLPDKNIKPLLIIETDKAAKLIKSSANLWLSTLTKISLNSLPVNYKLSQGLNSILALLEAKENQCYDGLLLNDLGQICETASANIFWIKNDILYTPSEKCGILLGTIRQKILDLSPIPTKTVIAKLFKLITADEIFITNTKLGVLHINKIMPSGKIFAHKKYSRIFASLLNQDILDYVKKEKSKMA